MVVYAVTGLALIFIFLLGFVSGVLTVVLSRASNERRKVKRKHGFGNEINYIDLSGNSDIINSIRKEQAANDFK